MRWKFILQQDFGYGAVDTVIEEPIGYAEAVFNINRDKDLHGVFFQYNATLKFYGDAYDLIYAEYLLNGVDGEMRLIIQFACSDTDDFEDFYTSKLNFSKIELENSTLCTLNLPIQDDTALTLFKNRSDQKCDMAATESFDGTPLDPYAALPFTLALAPKTIVKTDEYLHASPVVESEFNYSTAAGLQTFISFIYLKGVDMIEEIPSLDDDYQEGFTDTEVNVLPMFEFPFLNPGSGPYQLDLQYKVRLEIALNLGNGTLDGCDPIDRFDQVIVTLILRRKRGAGYDFFTVGTDTFNDCYNNTDNRFIEELVYTYSGLFPFPVLGGIIVTGDEVSYYLKVEVSGTYSVVLPGPITFDVVNTAFDHGDSFIKVTVPTIFPVTDAEVCMINEVLSRTTEAITNDQLRVYSDYFGRTDSEPYVAAEDGDGSLEALTTGLHIRRNDTALFKWSFKDIYDGANAIHNIGMGLEPDTVRGYGAEWLRIEKARYFYDPTVILTCDKIPAITRRVLSEEIYSIFNFGYNKWAAEEYNGLDEFATKREYRTTIQSVKNTLNQLSSIIASGYAIEITRQQYLSVSKDWKFDKDTFIICLLRTDPCCYDMTGFPVDPTGEGLTIYIDGAPSVILTGGAGWATLTDILALLNAITPDVFYISGSLFCVDDPTAEYGVLTLQDSVGVDEFTAGVSCGFIVEQGNITSPANLIDPATVYNFRISPNRNLLRWLWRVLESYVDPTTGELIFMDGEANYLAEGLMPDSVEAGVLSESETPVTASTMADIAEALPVYIPEQWSFRYPMSVEDYQAVKANPRGVINVRWGQNTSFYSCYIRQIEYKPVKGEAQFTLLPKYPFENVLADFDNRDFESVDFLTN